MEQMGRTCVPGTGPVLVVGAGAAGLSAARTLADRGLSVTVVDKARGVGGRIATRRLGDGLPYDHGATLFEPVTGAFRRRLLAWEAEGLVARTGPGEETFRARGGATALARSLARGLDVRLGAKAIALVHDGASFRLDLEEGEPLRAGVVLLTPPVPQTVDLLERGGLAERLPAGLAAGLRRVSYAAGVVLLLRLDRRVDGLPPSGIRLLRDGGLASRIVENERGGGTTRLSIYGRETFAAARRDAPDEQVASELEEAARAALGFPQAAVLERSLKRWRYARAERPFAGDDPVVELDGARLLFAGEAFGEELEVPAAGNTGLERAFLSGLVAAGRLAGFRG
jgi:predicted NAD/FAD-dependent oxidoreductase